MLECFYLFWVRICACLQMGTGLTCAMIFYVCSVLCLFDVNVCVFVFCWLPTFFFFLCLLYFVLFYFVFFFCCLRCQLMKTHVDQTFYDDYVILVFNIFITSLPPLFIALFEKDIEEHIIDKVWGFDISPLISCFHCYVLHEN